jgi:hypothetical protein
VLQVAEADQGARHALTTPPRCGIANTWPRPDDRLGLGRRSGTDAVGESSPSSLTSFGHPTHPERGRPFQAAAKAGATTGMPLLVQVGGIGGRPISIPS